MVSADGMLADAANRMPDALKLEADTRFFAAALDRTDLIVHGRHSQEDQPKSPLRKRIILTRAIASLAPDPENPKALLWNPSGRSFAEACERAGVRTGTVAIIGGPAVFDLFMDRYDTFWLSQAGKVRLPGGAPCFSGVPARSPQDVLAAHGLRAASPQILDPANAVSVTAWRRGGSGRQASP